MSDAPILIERDGYYYARTTIIEAAFDLGEVAKGYLIEVINGKCVRAFPPVVRLVPVSEPARLAKQSSTRPSNRVRRGRPGKSETEARRQALLAQLTKRPGMMRRDIATTVFDGNQSAAIWHLGYLQRHGLVRKKMTGREWRWYAVGRPAPPLSEQQLSNP